MGMTIGKAIEWYEGLECYTPQAKDARDVAIETMRKYQKIEQIADRVHHTGLEPAKAYELIQEVIEDGNDD